MAVGAISEHATTGDGTATLIVFSLDEAEYAVPVQQVVEALRMVAITPVPESPESVSGVINLRGRVIPILDLRRRLGLRPRPFDLHNPILVADDHERLVGLVVDEVIQMLTLPESAIDGPEALGRSRQAVSSVARMGDRLILILDLKSVCSVVDGVVIPTDALDES
ncbi:MAG: chemotaxis protein CheW, partial [Actinomycetota bacterium]